jgi:hypothetical protein
MADIWTSSFWSLGYIKTTHFGGLRTRSWEALVCIRALSHWMFMMRPVDALSYIFALVGEHLHTHERATSASPESDSGIIDEESKEHHCCVSFPRWGWCQGSKADDQQPATLLVQPLPRQWHYHLLLMDQHTARQASPLLRSLVIWQNNVVD